MLVQVGAVVVGFDRHINYYKIQYATLCISENPGCLFIATNLDAKTHLTDAQEWAGNGAMVGAIKGANQLFDGVYLFANGKRLLPQLWSKLQGPRILRVPPESDLGRFIHCKRIRRSRERLWTPYLVS